VGGEAETHRKNTRGLKDNGSRGKVQGCQGAPGEKWGSGKWGAEPLCGKPPKWIDPETTAGNRSKKGGQVHRTVIQSRKRPKERRSCCSTGLESKTQPPVAGGPWQNNAERRTGIRKPTHRRGSTTFTLSTPKSLVPNRDVGQKVADR